MLKTTQVIIPEPKSWQSSVCDLGLWSFDLKMYKYLPFTILHHSMYEISIENNQSYSIRTKLLTKWSLWPWPLDTKCIGIFLYPSLIYVWDTVWRQIFADENSRDLKVKVCERICNFYFRDFKWTDLWISIRINYCGFYFRDSVYSPRNRENKNPAKISRYTV